MARRARYRYTYTYKRQRALKKAQAASARKRKRMALGVLAVGVGVGAVYAGTKVYKRNNNNVAAQVQSVTPPAATPNPPRVRQGVPQGGPSSSAARSAASTTMGFKRILITGSRDWADAQTVHDALEGQLVEHGSIVVVHGAARGADSIADSWAKKKKAEGHKVEVESYPADWNRHGKAAGPIRNQQMVDLGAHVTLAFPLGKSVGTRHAMRAAQKAGIRVINYG